MVGRRGSTILNSQSTKQEAPLTAAPPQLAFGGVANESVKTPQMEMPERSQLGPPTRGGILRKPHRVKASGFRFARHARNSWVFGVPCALALEPVSGFRSGESRCQTTFEILFPRLSTAFGAHPISSW